MSVWVYCVHVTYTAALGSQKCGVGPPILLVAPTPSM